MISRVCLAFKETDRDTYQPKCANDDHPVMITEMIPNDGRLLFLSTYMHYDECMYGDGNTAS